MIDDFHITPSMIEFVIMGLATWRLAFLLVYEGGPFGIVRRMRQWLGIDHDPERQPLPYVGGGFGGLFSCIWCMSFWQAIMVLTVWVYAPYVVVGLALWGGASLIDWWLGRDS